MPVYVEASGPCPANIMAVGECPGPNEEARGENFVGPAGWELNRQLADAGIPRAACYVTNVYRHRPRGDSISSVTAKSKKAGTEKGYTFRDGLWVDPVILEHIEHLKLEIRECSPNVILALGNLSLWALTGQTGITNWQGSEMASTLVSRADGTPYKVIPALHPSHILRGQQDKRYQTVHYLRKLRRESETPEIFKEDFDFVIRPSIDKTISWLAGLLTCLAFGPVKLSADIETRGGHIACIGLGTSKTKAICIPFMSISKPQGYWTPVEELHIVCLLRKILHHPNVRLVGQNWAYDAQYLARFYGIFANLYMDTMTTHHTLYPGLLKALDFQASLYCDHYCWWKGESKEWRKTMEEERLWRYNCLDCVRTFEISDVLETAQHDTGFGDLSTQVAFQSRLHRPLVKMMFRGVAQDETAREVFSKELTIAIKEHKAWFINMLGHPLNPRSNPQMMALFHDDLRQRVILNRYTHRPTLDEKALIIVGKREPLLQPLIKKIADLRSLGVFKSTFVDAETDTDGRIRCSFNQSGAETFRFSSSKDAFGKGCNLQTIPEGDEGRHLPNVKKLFVPDPGKILMDWDLARADAQVVAWEAKDEELKQILREGLDIHTENSKLLGITRHLAKQWVHLTNYGGSPYTAARTCGITVHQATEMQQRWFSAHPGIPRWHKRTEAQLKKTHSVSNKFGYVRYYFGPVGDLLPEALAWVPQSTVAITINHGLIALDETLPTVELLLQVHDSLLMQTKAENWPRIHSQIKQRMEITVPYDDPLVIPVGCKWSAKNWGEVVEYEPGV